MTNIIFVYNNNKQIIAIKIFGHSGYSKKNSDIICSSISSIINFINILLKNIYKIKINTKIDSKIPLVYISIPNNLSEDIIIKTQEIFKASKIYFQSMNQIYFKYIKISEEKNNVND